MLCQTIFCLQFLWKSISFLTQSSEIIWESLRSLTQRFGNQWRFLKIIENKENLAKWRKRILSCKSRHVDNLFALKSSFWKTSPNRGVLIVKIVVFSRYFHFFTLGKKRYLFSQIHNQSEGGGNHQAIAPHTLTVYFRHLCLRSGYCFGPCFKFFTKKL